MSKYAPRKEAYRYILERLSKLPVASCAAEQYLSISLDELRLLKEGVTDPSAALVAALKQLFRGIITEAEIALICVSMKRIPAKG